MLNEPRAATVVGRRLLDRELKSTPSIFRFIVCVDHLAFLLAYTGPCKVLL